MAFDLGSEVIFLRNIRILPVLSAQDSSEKLVPWEILTKQGAWGAFSPHRAAG